ncbi:unnamed protein product [Camellia sinensis]
MDSEVSSSHKKVKEKVDPSKPRRLWSPREEQCLINALMHIVNNGMKQDNAFKAGYLMKLEEKLLEMLPGTNLRGTPHIESKIKIWKKHYNCVAGMLGTSGFGWNDTKKRIDVESDSVWEAYVQGNAQRPEVRVVTWNNDELATDALPIHGFDHYKAKDYALAHALFSGSNYAGGQWAAGDEPLYYIVSPKDVVIAKPRDTTDHISWLLQHGWHEKALAAVEAGQGRSELLDKVGSSYHDHLIVERKYIEAASLCPKLLRGSVSAWKRLHDTSYEVAFVALTTNPSFHKDLLSTVKSWPPVIYSALPIISAIEPQLNTSSMTDALAEALAELYVIDGRYEKAFALYANVVQLMMTDYKCAVPLLTQHKDLITASKIVNFWLWGISVIPDTFYICICFHYLKLIRMLEGISMICRFEI